MKSKTLSILLLVLLCSINLFAQRDQIVRKKNGTTYHKTQADGDCSNNYSTVGNVNPFTGKPGTVNCDSDANAVQVIVSAPGTGEYFLVPAIVRKDPEGTAVRFNTCGTALMALYDKGAIFTLTDGVKQRLTPTSALIAAESRFRKATEFVPDNYLYHMNLGVVLYRQRRITEALAAMSRALELNPNDPTLQDYEARIRREKTTVVILDDDQEN